MAPVVGLGHSQRTEAPLPFDVPRMRRIQRPAVDVTTTKRARYFKLSLRSAMAGRAQSLPIRLVKEQHFVSSVWHNVVNHPGHRDAARRLAEPAKGMRPKVSAGLTAPAAQIV